MLRIKLHELFKQFNKNFDLFCRIQPQTIRQNRLKQLEGIYRRFQSEFIALNNSDFRKQHYDSLEEIFDQNVGVKNQDQKFIKVLVEGLINNTYNQAIRLEKKLLGMQNIKFSNINLKKKPNTYTLREMSFFTNQEKKQKIDMKRFIE